MRNMKLFSVIVACTAGLLAAQAHAQVTQKPRGGTSKRPAAPVAKPVPKAEPAAPVELTSEQLSIAQIVHTGRIACADGHSVTITPDAKTQGAFDLQFGSTKYDVVPIPSKSGAIRLEDQKFGIVYMQLANKSMLFNERQNRRLADNCINDAQRAVAETMRLQNTPSVLDTAK